MSEYSIGDYFKAIYNKIDAKSEEEVVKNSIYLCSIFNNAARNDKGRDAYKLETNDNGIFDALVNKALRFLTFAKNNPGFDSDLDYDQDNKITDDEIQRIINKSNA